MGARQGEGRRLEDVAWREGVTVLAGIPVLVVRALPEPPVLLAVNSLEGESKQWGTEGGGWGLEEVLAHDVGLTCHLRGFLCDGLEVRGISR
jgi:hypothetical protein